MRIKHHIAIVILTCSVGGLGLAMGISEGRRSIEFDAVELGPDSVTIENVSRLETQIGQWLLSCDLLLQTDSTYLLEGAQLQSDEAVTLLTKASDSRLATESIASIETLIDSIRRINTWVAEAAFASGPGRRRQLDDVVVRVDRESIALIDELGVLSQTISTRATAFVAELEQRRTRLNQASWVGSVAYLCIVFLTWIWTSANLVRPVRQLSIAARERSRENWEVQRWLSGPTEIRELASTMSDFAKQLWFERATIEKVNTRLRDEITERRQVESELRASHTYLEELHSMIPGSFVLLDENRVITEINDTALKLLNYERQNLVGKAVDVFWTDAEAMLVPSREGLSRHIHVAEVTWTSASETLIPLDVSVVRRTTAGKAPGFVCIGLDIRDRKRLVAEVQRGHAQKMEAVGQLAAGIAHEINTPMQFVTDNLHFLRDSTVALQELLRHYGALKTAGTVSADTLNALTDAEHAADLPFIKENLPEAMDATFEGMRRVTTIISAMKTFAHPLSGDAELFDLNDAVTTALTMAYHEYKYVADAETDLEDLPLVMGHSSDVNQVLLNLVVNAAHAITERGTDTTERGQLTVRTRRDGDDVELRISDTGVGIPDAIQHRIFDLFFTTKDVGKGTGHGLALAHAIVVDKHHGSLRFETRVNQGTTFIMRLPIHGSSEFEAEEIAGSVINTEKSAR